MINRASAVAVLFLALLLGGCFYDQPLTSFPSKDLNTWLLGVWEQREASGKVSRVTVTPLTGGKYTVYYQVVGKNKKDTKNWLFEGWISRVGSASFLTLRCEQSDGEIPVGSYAFVHYQVAQQNLVYIRPVQLEALSSASSYELRTEVRRRLKDQSLLSAPGSAWIRVSEVYWDPANPPVQPYQPLRYPLN